MSIAPGDLVTVGNRRGLWAVVEPLSHGKARDWWRVAQPGRTFEAGQPGIKFVSRPSFTEGETIRHRGRPATVVTDDGGPLVRLHQENRRQLRGGEFVVTEGPVDAFRWALALENGA